MRDGGRAVCRALRYFETPSRRLRSAYTGVIVCKTIKELGGCERLPRRRLMDQPLASAIASQEQRLRNTLRTKAVTGSVRKRATT